MLDAFNEDDGVKIYLLVTSFEQEYHIELMDVFYKNHVAKGEKGRTKDKLKELYKIGKEFLINAEGISDE